MLSDPVPVMDAWPEATARLLACPAFGPLVERAGPVRMESRGRTPFEALVAAIIYQQLAGAAARTIHGRFTAALGGAVTPSRVLAAGDDALRAAGLSAGKLAAIRDLAEKCATRTIRLDRLDGMSDDDVVAELVQVRGVGAWTAHMYLLFELRRPDIWPTGDLGVRSGLGRVLGMPEAPTPREAELIGVGYRPWRSAVAWYCWRAVELLPRAGGG
jgi:DNA-3-methyladenine glycosylase II